MMLGNIATEIEIPESLSQIEVTGITSDSRKVKPGYIFAALSGEKTDGRNFIPDAEAAGAVAVLTSGDTAATDWRLPVLHASDPRRSLALMASKLAGRQPANMVAVTGTSGKTSVAVFVRQIFTKAGFQAASLGTIGTVSPMGTNYEGLTTPDPVDLHENLAKLAGEGVTHAVLEASSHGLDQRRIDGVELSACAFTNIGRDHMDYHASFDDYLNAKMRLFESLAGSDTAVVYDPLTPHSNRIAEICRQRNLRTITVGRNGDHLRLDTVTVVGMAQELKLSVNGAPHEVRLPLVGEFQVSNALIAVGLAMAVGIDEDVAVEAMRNLEGAPGRLEFVGKTSCGALIFIDYAHKPDALETALTTLRPYASKKLVCVVGAGGDRDRGKRPMIGAAAAKYADTVFVTDDNPRSEDPGAIRRAVLDGAPGAEEIADRTEAIRTAISRLQDGDILCIAGKGHETGQIVGDRVLEYSDHDAVTKILSEEKAK